MQTTPTTLDANDATLQLGPAAPRMIVPGLIMAGIGGLVAYLCGFRVAHAPTLFYHAYLVAFVFYLTITLGSLFFVMLHHLARSGWSVTLRRLAEALSGNMALLALLFVPLIFGLGDIYPWAKQRPLWSAAIYRRFEADVRPRSYESGIREDETVSQNKSGNELPHSKDAESGPRGAVAGHSLWFPPPKVFRFVIPWKGSMRIALPVAFIGRFIIYFVIWGFLAWYFRGHSILQDSTGSVALTRRMERTAAPGMILFAFTITLAAVDLIMSLNPGWCSTMIGVYLFSDAVLSGLVAITLLALGLQSCGLLRGAISVEHYHDLGKLTFGFVFFWGYIAFSQYMLIWYANMPDETQFYMSRQIGPWAAVSLALIVVHFVLPFVGLMSKHVKRWLPLHAFWLIWLLVAHAFDLFWLIMPNVFIRELPVDNRSGASLPEAFKTLLESQQSVYQLSPGHQAFMDCVNAPLTPAAIATVVGLLVAMGGLYIANTAWLLSAARLAPVKDPRLNESLGFHNV